MKKLLILLISLSAFALYSFRPVINNGEWISYKSNKAFFAADFPVKPEETIQKLEKASICNYAAKSGSASFEVHAKVFSNAVDSRPEVLEKNMLAFRLPFNGQIESRSSFKIGDKEGIDASIKGDNDTCARYRIIVIGSTMFELIVTDTKKYAGENDVNKFFGSFKIIE
jgi:hypothetical protein